MTLRGWAGGNVRAPLLPLTEAQSDELRNVLSSILADVQPAQHRTKRAHA